MPRKPVLPRGGPPLARGSRPWPSSPALPTGWTPARAGKPTSTWASTPRRRVDPRSRGEAWACTPQRKHAPGGPPLARGSRPGAAVRPRADGWTPGGPPLARGSHLSTIHDTSVVGWTPARAGKPRSRARASTPPRVDPRSRGEALGREPRQPRGRGWTPARGGSLLHHAVVHDLARVDPRSRGEATVPASPGGGHQGGPPLARGSRQAVEHACLGVGWTPARAGKPCSAARPDTRRKVDPRSRGEAAIVTDRDRSTWGGPPLARGSRPTPVGAPFSLGWTPARAGKPAPRACACGRTWVDPRSRGEAGATSLRLRAYVGGPPLARGSRARQRARRTSAGWTPARAGKPP